jgi:hypothetical protein
MKMRGKRVLETIQRHLEPRDTVVLSSCSSSGGDSGLMYDYWAEPFPSTAAIGKVTLPLVRPAVPELVPFGVVPDHALLSMQDDAVLETMK